MKTKTFTLLVIDTGTLKNFKGRDVWDAYRKACNEYEHIRTVSKNIVNYYNVSNSSYF